MFIKLTSREDLNHVQQLWGNGDVMRYVGFPNGLQVTMEHLETEWLPWVQNYPARQHYSVYYDNTYSGEAFYDVDELGFACMDIKLLPDARGKGIASFALSHALDQAFLLGGATVAWVDPDPKNSKALRLYERLGFEVADRPSHLEAPGCEYVYMEVRRDAWQLRRGIHYRNILLRDLVESDIEDWIRWETVETEWMDWDAPDEPSDPINEEEYRCDLLDFVKTPRSPGFRSFFEIADTNGLHIGRINSYSLDESLEWQRWPENEFPERVAVGIDICSSSAWNHGYGKKALAAFLRYLESCGIQNLYTQTWSGNVRMVHCALKLGFTEVKRIIADRQIRGGVYDSVTFQLDLDRFHKYLLENP